MRFLPITLIPIEEINPLQASLEGTLEGDLGTSSPGTTTCLLLFFFFIFSLFPEIFPRLCALSVMTIGIYIKKYF